MGVELKIKKLSENAVIPFLATADAAACDVTATSIKVVDGGDYGYIEYGLGFAVEIPKGYCMKILPRSSIRSTGLIMCNAPGLIDADYRDEVLVSFKYVKDSKKYEVGDRVAQIRIEKNEEVSFVEVDTLSETERKGGHGSTGK